MKETYNKDMPLLSWAGKRLPEGTEEITACRETEVYGQAEGSWRNRLYLGDNLQILKELGRELSGQVDLIYIDPPFDSHADYKKKIFLKASPGGQRKALQILETHQYGDTWGEGEYLQFIYERLWAARRLLREGGNIVLHCDWHRDHHLRCLMDEVFGAENFRNEIIYCYSGGGIPRGEMPKKHDVLLWYSNGKNWTYHVQYRSYSEGTVKRGRTAVKGEHAALREQGTPLNDWWTDVKKITSPTDPEKLYYPTQKSEELLERIITMLSDPGDLVMDFFMGSGTAPAAAVKLGRRFIGMDNNPAAVQTAVNRLARLATGFAVYEKDGPARGERSAVAVQTADETLYIRDFRPAELLKELEKQGVSAEDWRQYAEAVYIDWNYDGRVFRPQVCDVPGRREYVSGSYGMPEKAKNICVKVVDLLMEGFKEEEV